MLHAETVAAVSRPTPSPGVGSIQPPWPDVRRIAVLRGGGLGDLLFTLPATEALAAAYPDAEVVLLGAPLHADLLTGRPGAVSQVLTLPAAKGLHEPPDQAVDQTAQEVFFDQVRGKLDLAVQLHGGGRWSNPFLHRLEATWTVGACSDDAVPLTRSVPYRYYQHEILRCLEIVGMAGAPPVALEPEVAIVQADLDAAASTLDGLPTPVLVVHPGARDPRRRWPPDRFAAVIAALAEAGAGVVVVGSAAERELVEFVAESSRLRLSQQAARNVRAVTDLDMSGLCGVLASSHAVVANDSGPRHLAGAVGTPTVSVYWMGNVMMAGPLSRAWHRVLISWTPACPVCGIDATRENLPRCAHDVSFVTDVPTSAVLREAEDLLGAVA